MDAHLIKKLRNISNLSQQDLSERTGLSRSYISLIELGERRLNPDAELKIKQVFAEEGLYELEINLLKVITDASNLKRVYKDWKGVN